MAYRFLNPEGTAVVLEEEAISISNAHPLWSIRYLPWAATNTTLPYIAPTSLPNASIVTFPDITLAQLATMAPASYKGMSYNLTNPAGNSAGSGIKSNGTSWVYITDDSPVIY